MRFHRDQPPRARDRGVIWRRLGQPQLERMCHRPRPLRVGNPKLFLRLPLLRSSSHRHTRSLRTSALDYARNFTSESRLSPRTARFCDTFPQHIDVARNSSDHTFAYLHLASCKEIWLEPVLVTIPLDG